MPGSPARPQTRRRPRCTAQLSWPRLSRPRSRPGGRVRPRPLLFQRRANCCRKAWAWSAHSRVRAWKCSHVTRAACGFAIRSPWCRPLAGCRPVHSIAHRPRPSPPGPWIMKPTCHDLLFAHWPVPPGAPLSYAHVRDRQVEWPMLGCRPVRDGRSSRSWPASSAPLSEAARRPDLGATQTGRIPAYNAAFHPIHQAAGELSMAFSGRVAFVTGASQGIGRTCALRLAQEGAAVAAAARNQEKLDQLVGEISSAGGKAASFAVDVADEEQVRSAVKSAIAQFGKIDILVNNAGITRDQLVMRMKRADWDAVVQTNLTSAYLCIQQVIPSMHKQRWGRIINVTSVFGQMGQAGQANYAASKAGLIGLTMAIAREVGSRNITCNAVAPGFIETPMTDVLGDEFKQNAVKQIPLGRVGKTEDIAGAVAFLASDDASYITGHVLSVNGGMLMG